MPSLQLHLLRVGAVAQLIMNNISISANENKVLQATLLHDIGNMIKFKLDMYPEFLKPEGYEYWKKVKDKMIDKYGKDEHIASLMIAEELGVSESILNIISCIEFTKVEQNVASKDINKKIAAYADTRVGIRGIQLQEERWREARERYKLNKNKAHLMPEERLEYFLGFHAKLEEQIFEFCKITPKDINDNSVAPIIEELKKYDI